MVSNITSPEKKSSLSQEDLSNLVCGMTIFSILLLMICFICVLWKIYSDEEITQSHENLRTLLQRKRRPRNKSRSTKKAIRWIDTISRESEHRAPNNTPVGSVGKWET